MSRNLAETQEALLVKLLREKTMTIRDIAERVGCGTGTVQRRKKELGYDVRQQRRVTNMPSPTVVEALSLPTPSAAARRLAEFDPIVRRAISSPTPDGEDEDE